MLTTNPNQALQFFVEDKTDSTVFLNSGTVMLNKHVMTFRGGNLAFSKMTDFSGGSNLYQLSILCLRDFNNFPDMTAVPYPTVSSTNLLISPYLDSTVLKPIGQFLFYTDGTSIVNVDSARIQ
jgi:hypothetical protein